MTLNFLPVANLDPDVDPYQAMQERIYELERENQALKLQIAELRGAIEVLLAPPVDANIR